MDILRLLAGREAYDAYVRGEVVETPKHGPVAPFRGGEAA